MKGIISEFFSIKDYTAVDVNHLYRNFLRNQKTPNSLKNSLTDKALPEYSSTTKSKLRKMERYQKLEA
jgi:hypothetical protein